MHETTVPSDLIKLKDRILSARRAKDKDRSLLVGISGIDGSGKGFITDRLRSELEHRGRRTAAISVDRWLNLPQVRFSAEDRAQHFYLNAVRMDELFPQLINPLTLTRSVDLLADTVEETACEFRRHRYNYNAIDIILLEGIYLFKKSRQSLFDLRVWIDCTFDTALERALERRQEGLSRDETVKAYAEIYFPAQELHFKIDRPRDAADLIIKNDARLSPYAH